MPQCSPSQIVPRIRAKIYWSVSVTYVPGIGAFYSICTRIAQSELLYHICLILKRLELYSIVKSMQVSGFRHCVFSEIAWWRRVSIAERLSTQVSWFLFISDIWLKSRAYLSTRLVVNRIRLHETITTLSIILHFSQNRFVPLLW